MASLAAAAPQLSPKAAEVEQSERDMLRDILDVVRRINGSATAPRSDNSSRIHNTTVNNFYNDSFAWHEPFTLSDGTVVRIKFGKTWSQASETMSRDMFSSMVFALKQWIKTLGPIGLASHVVEYCVGPLNISTTISREGDEIVLRGLAIGETHESHASKNLTVEVSAAVMAPRRRGVKKKQMRPE